MAPVVASLVEWGDLLKVVWVSFAAGIGVTVVFALAIVGATGMVDNSREGRRFGAAASGLLLVLSLALCAAAIVLGVVAMTAK